MEFLYNILLKNNEIDIKYLYIIYLLSLIFDHFYLDNIYYI